MTTSNENFEDPLENYDNPSFDDPIEQALYDESVAALQTQPHMCVSGDTTVRDTMQLMTGKHISCVLVEDDDSEDDEPDHGQRLGQLSGRRARLRPGTRSAGCPR